MGSKPINLLEYIKRGKPHTLSEKNSASTLVGGFPGGAEVDSFAFATGYSDVLWLSEAPASGTVTAGGSTDITVTFSTRPAWGSLVITTHVRVDELPLFSLIISNNDSARLDGYLYNRIRVGRSSIAKACHQC